MSQDVKRKGGKKNWRTKLNYSAEQIKAKYKER